jgi:hypothetical protein
MNANLNRKASILAAIIAGTLVAFPAASAPPMARMPTQVQLIPNLGILTAIRAVSCTVAGTPVEFPDDIVIRNTGNVTLPAGTSISWHVGAFFSGVHTLAAPLTPNQTVFLSGALPGGWPAASACSATII